MKEICKSLLLGALLAVGPASPVIAQQATNPTPAREVSKVQQLNSAILKDDLAEVKALIEADPALIKAAMAVRSQGALTIAVTNGRTAITKYLLEKGADPNSEYGGSSILSNLMTGSGANWLVLADALVEKGADVNRLDSNGNSPLFRALRHPNSEGRRQRMEWLLNNKADVTLKNNAGQSAIETAFLDSGNSIEILNLLLQKADIKVRDMEGNSLLHMAASRNNIEAVRLLVEKGVAINAQNRRGDTALHLIAANPASLLKVLLDAGANPNIKNGRGDLPLHIALRRLETLSSYTNDSGGSTNISSPQGYVMDGETTTPRGTLITSLIAKTDVTLRDQYGMPPLLTALLARDQESRDLIMAKAPKMDLTTQLFEAAASGNTSVMKSLLAQRPFLVYFRLPDGSTPLHMSALWGTSGVTQILLLKGAEVNARDSIGQTPLHRAISRPTGIFLRRSKNMVKLLISNKADASTGDQSGLTPLHRAVVSGDIELVRLLLESNAKVNVSDSNGVTPLMLAIDETTPIAISNLLLSKGADVNVRNSSMATPLSLAVGVRRLDLVEALIAKGAEVTYKGAEGRGLLGQLIARHGGTTNEDSTRGIFTLLLAKGADPNDRISATSLAATLINNGSESSKELLKLLLATKKVPLVGQYYGSRQPLLGQAIMYGRKEMIEILLEAGADVNDKDAQGRSMLQIANTRPDKSIVELLKAKGAVE
jgi:ankyrin repeat protein